MATWNSTPSVPHTGGTFNFPQNTTNNDIVYTIRYTDDNGCTASKQKNVTLKNREFMTFEVTCNNENTLVVYTKANEEFTYGIDIRNSDNSFDDSQLSTLATILNQSEYTEEKYLEVEDISVNGIGLTSFLNTEVPEPTE